MSIAGQQLCCPTRGQRQSKSDEDREVFAKVGSSGEFVQSGNKLWYSVVLVLCRQMLRASEACSVNDIHGNTSEKRLQVDGLAPRETIPSDFRRLTNEVVYEWCHFASGCG